MENFDPSKYDAKDRRKRFLFRKTSEGLKRERIPSRHPVRLTPRMLDILFAMHRSGGFGHATHIHPLVSDFKDSTRTRQCFKHMFHDFAVTDEQILNRRCEKDKTFHKIDDAGVRWLKAEGLWYDNAPKPTGHVMHQIFVSVLLQTFEGNAKYRPCVFTPQHEFWTGEYMQVDGKDVKPDAVFKLEINGKTMLCFLEADRATESYGTLKDKAQTYHQVIKNKLYQKPYQHTQGALVLFVTTNERREQGIIQHAIKSPCTYMLVTHVDGFGTFFDPPDKLELLRREWSRSGKDPVRFLSGLSTE